MDNTKIMNAMRLLTEAFSDGDERNGRALNEVDRLNRRLSDLFDYDFKEGESVFADVPPSTDSNPRYVVCCEFDGVLHSHTSGWEGYAVAHDFPVRGALAWLVEMAHDDRFEIHIHSYRSKDLLGVTAMRGWLRGALWTHYELHEGPPYRLSVREVMSRLQFPTHKPRAMLTIDSRAFCFEGTFPSAEWILGFQPWYKRDQ